MAIDPKWKKDINNLIEKFKKSRGLTDSKRVKIGFMSDDESIGKIERLPTGIIGIDTLTGGGLIKGKINQIWGSEGCGKSTIILRAIGNIQARDPSFIANYQNNEDTFDKDYAIFNGVDPSRLLIGNFSTNEEVADFCNQIIDPELHVGLSAFDTIQALACEGELFKGKKKDLASETDNRTEKSVSDDTMALLPRMYSQFLRMYTSKTTGHLTLILASQVRMDLGNTFGAKARETGGHAIKHYKILALELAKAGLNCWPGNKEALPPNSFPVRVTIAKAKMMNRYIGNSIIIYFYKGSFEHKFNVVAIAKDLGLFDGKKLTYTTSKEDGTEETKDFSARGFYDFYNKVPVEAVAFLEKQIPDAYTKSIMIEKPKE